MIKQEEIREGIAEQIYFNHPQTRDYEVAGRVGIPYSWDELNEVGKDRYREEAGNMMIFLHSQDVAIKADRELPETIFLPGSGYIQGHQLDCLLDKLNIVSVEPLIE